MMQETRPASAAAPTGRTEALQTSKTTIRKLALASVCALAALTIAASNANATPTQYAWKSNFTDQGPVDGYGSSGNTLFFTGTFSQTSYTKLLSTASGSYTIQDYLTICETGSFQDISPAEEIAVSFNFTQPGKGSGSLDGSIAVSETNYRGKVDASGTISWDASPLLISFADGAKIQIQLSSPTWVIGQVNGCGGADQCAKVDATFTVLKDPVPEPASLALLGVGMIGTGIAARRRRSSTSILAA